MKILKRTTKYLLKKISLLFPKLGFYLNNLIKNTYYLIPRLLNESLENCQPLPPHKSIVYSDIKNLAYELMREKRFKLAARRSSTATFVGLSSKGCTQEDIESDWFAHWCQKIKVTPIYHRKIWEFCYILQVLFENQKLVPGLKAIGFGCGEEPLPSVFASYGISVLATDAPSHDDNSWRETGQYMMPIDKILEYKLCDEEILRKNLKLQYIDMNDLSQVHEKDYDFCWSACALEHLGSIQKGLDFIKKSVNVLKVGGISVHTTELNLSSNEKTLDNNSTVLFRKKDLEKIAEQLTDAGHKVYPFNFDTGSGWIDQYIDLPTHPKIQDHLHLKLLVNGYQSTSFGIIIEKTNDENR